MIPAVGHIQRVAPQRQALRIVEGSLVERAIGLLRLAGAGNGDLLALQVRNNNAMVGAVGDEQAPPGGIGQDLAGEKQRAIPALPETGEIKAQRLFVEGFLLTVFLDQLGDRSHVLDWNGLEVFPQER